jgi:hypothetical protein
MATGDSKATGFTINDRRTFTDGGDPRQETQERHEVSHADGHAGHAGHDGHAGQPHDDGKSAALDEPPTSLPAVDFHTFVLSLGSSALLHLGELEHPDVGAPQKDLSLAKHTIDILVMLEEKTKGNLTAAEEKLIASLLYDLRLRYVEASKG